MSSIQADVLSVFVSESNARLSGKEIASAVCQARKGRGSECSVAMVKLAINQFVAQMVLSKYAFAEIFNLTNIGLVLVGKSPETPDVKAHLARHGYLEIPLKLDVATVEKRSDPKISSDSSQPSGIKKNQRRTQLNQKHDGNKNVDTDRFAGIIMPPYADALHFSLLERAIAGLLYDNLSKAGAPLSVHAIGESFSESPEKLTQSLSMLKCRDFVNFVDNNSAEKSMAWMTESQAADLGFESKGKALTPYLSLYGLSMTSQSLLRHMVTRRTQENKYYTSEFQAAQFLAQIGVVSGDPEVLRNFAVQSLQILVSQGLISYAPSNGAYQLSAQTMVLLGMRAPTSGMIQKMEAHESLRKFWAILQAHPSFVSSNNAPTADLFPKAPVSDNETPKGLDVSETAETSDAGQMLSVDKPEIELQTTTLLTDKGAEIMTTHDDEKDLHMIALEKLQLIAATAVKLPRLDAVASKMKILDLIAKSFAYDQPDVMQSLNAVAADLSHNVLDGGDDSDLLSSRVVWASRRREIAGFDDKVALLQRLASAFSPDQPEISGSLQSIADDLKLIIG